MDELKFLKFLYLLSCIGLSYGTSKPVSVRDKKMGQLVTSSLLTWENFHQADGKTQLEYAISGGEFTGVDVI